MDMVHTYPFSVPSIAEKHPGISEDLIQALGLGIALAAGAQVGAGDAAQAEHDETFLRVAAKKGLDTITDEVVETAANRACLLREIAASVAFPGVPGNAGIAATLQAINTNITALTMQVDALRTQTTAQMTALTAQMTALDTTVTNQTTQMTALTAQMTALDTTVTNQIAALDTTITNGLTASRNLALATAYNSRVIAKNARILMPLQWRQKEIEGNGLAKVMLLLGGHQVPQVINAAVGDLPGPGLNTVFGTFTHRDVFEHIMFYNDDFGILLNDALYIRKEKMEKWLTSGV